MIEFQCQNCIGNQIDDNGARRHLVPFCPRKRVPSFPLGISVEKYRAAKKHNAEVTNKGFHVEALKHGYDHVTYHRDLHCL